LSQPPKGLSKDPNSDQYVIYKTWFDFKINNGEKGIYLSDLNLIKKNKILLKEATFLS
jgi:hypothetical protein